MKSISIVVKWSNGLISAFDHKGRIIPEFQCSTKDQNGIDKILLHCNQDTCFQMSARHFGALKEVSREEFQSSSTG